MCPSHAGTVPRRMKIGSCGLHCDVAKHSSLRTPTMVEKRRLRPISAHNVSTVTASQERSFNSFINHKTNKTGDNWWTGPTRLIMSTYSGPSKYFPGSYKRHTITSFRVEWALYSININSVLSLSKEEKMHSHNYSFISFIHIPVKQIVRQQLECESKRTNDIFRW